MDVETGECMEELGDSAVDFSCELDASDEMFDLEETTAHELTEDDLWQPFSQFEPELPSERLQVIDDFADKVEIQRLFGMSVLCKHGDYTGKLGTQLSAKFVRTWRKKTRLQHDVDGHVVSSRPASKDGSGVHGLWLVNTTGWMLGMTFTVHLRVQPLSSCFQRFACQKASVKPVYLEL